MYLEETFNEMKMVNDQNLLQVEWKTRGNEFIFEKMDFEKVPKGSNHENAKQSSAISK